MVESLTKLGDMKFKEALTVLIPAGIGAVLGMFALMPTSWSFRRFHDVAVATITGFCGWSAGYHLASKMTLAAEMAKLRQSVTNATFPARQYWIAALVILVGVNLTTTGKDKVKS
jgi:hypothetical protein